MSCIKGNEKELFLRTLDALLKAGIEKVFPRGKLSVLPHQIRWEYDWHRREYRALRR